MEWLTLPRAPDFASAPIYQYESIGDQTQISAAESVIAFPSPQGPEEAWKFAYTFLDRRTIATFKQFLHTVGGRHENFLVPSWRADHGLISAPKGSGDLIITGNGYDLTRRSPDTRGRYIYLWAPGDSTAGIYTVVQAENVGGNQSLRLESLLAKTYDPAAGAIAGEVRLMRFANDSFQWSHISTDVARIELAFREARRLVLTEQKTAITPFTYAQSLGFSSVEQTPESVDIVHTGIAHATGPANLHIPQQNQYATSWATWVDTFGTIRIVKAEPGDFYPPSDSEGLPSTLASAGIAPSGPISLAFDQNAYEVVAYEVGETVEVRAFFNGTTQRIIFPGRTPVLFFNGLGDVAAQASGLSDVVCYYLRRDSGQLYARFQRDQYGIEYTVTPPAQLFALKETRLTDRREILFGYDSGMRKTVLTSPQYPPPPPPPPPSPFVSIQEAPDVSLATVTISGDYVDALVQPISPTEVSAPTVVVSGTYADGISEAAPIADASAPTVTIAGTYADAIIASAGGDGAAPTVTIAATYTQTVIRPPGDTIEGAAPTVVVAGTSTQLIFDPRTKNENLSPTVSVAGTYAIP